MKKQQRWSGVKLTKEELKEVRKAERIELFAEVLVFLFMLAIMFIVVVVVLALIGAFK